MAKLPDFTALPSNTPQGDGRIPTYQAGVAQAGMAQAAEGFARLGDKVANFAEQMQDRENEMWARDASTKLMLDMNKLSGEFRQKTGREAFDAYPAHQKALEELRLQAMKGAPNVAASRMLEGPAGSIFQQNAVGSQSYAAEQFKVGEQRSLVAANDGLITNGINNQNNQQAVRQSADAMYLNGLRIAEGKGLRGPEAVTVAQAEVGRFYRDLLGNMVGQPGGIERAAALFDQVRTTMDGPSQTAISNMLQPKLEQSRGDAVADAKWTGSAETDKRADAVRDGFIKRGFSPAAAIGLAANAVQESGARADAPVGDGGISHGLFQWNKERLDRFKAKYGKLPGQATLDEQLDFATEELNTTERAAGDALRAAQTPEEAAKIASTKFLRPKDTANEETRRSAIASRLGRRGYAPPGSATGGPETAPDMERMTRDILDMHLPPAEEAAAIAGIRRRNSVFELNTSTERDALTRTFADTKAALLAGKADVDIPEARIRAVFPPARAADMIGELRVAQGAGQALASVAMGTPAEIDATRADLASGQGYLSTMLRMRSGQASGNETGTEGKETPDQFMLRQRVLSEFNQQVQRRQDVLNQDAASYAAQAPTVQAAMTAAQSAPNDPKAQQAVIDASLAAQAHLGVPPEKRRALTNAQVAENVAKITRLDPEKADLGLELDRMLKGYGEHAERVFGEMVQQGKLPGEYQVLATMTAAGQVSGRQDLQRALALVSQPGGMEKLKTGAGQANVAAIDKELPSALAEFRETTKWQSGGAQLYSNVEHAAKLLAMRYAFQGQTASTAVETAVRMVTTEKYDFSDTMRMPKGMKDQVRSAAAMVQAGLKPDDLEEIPGNRSLSQAERQNILVGAVRRGEWVPNRDDTGLQLVITLADGKRVAMRRDNSPVEIRFDNLPTAAGRASMGPPPLVPVRPAGFVPAPMPGAR